MTDVDLGLPISHAEFERKLRHYQSALDGGSELTTEDFVEIVRLHNTIAWNRDTSAEAAAFSARFGPAEVRKAGDALSMTLSKGMGLYSREHDLYLGGSPHANSMYAVSEK